jgi:hypothetical protein
MPDATNDKRLGRRVKSATSGISAAATYRAPANDAGVSVFGGVYQPANLDRWASFPCWEAFEAACVTCGFDPYPLQSAAREDLEAHSSALSEIEYRDSLFRRSIRMKIVGEDISPMEALQILEGRNCWVPPELKELALDIAQIARQPYNPAASGMVSVNDVLAAKLEAGCRFKTKSGQTKVIKLYQRMLLAVSLDYLDLVPERPQNPTAKLFLKSMARHFKDLPDEDTVRDHIGFWINDHLER